MFAGHVGVALAAARVEPRLGLDVLTACALLLDLLLWAFILCGWESVIIPAEFAATHQPEFAFPYSHSLLAGISWAAVAAACVFLVFKWRKAAPLRAALVVAAVVLSHWLLDALVHRPEMPLAGTGSTEVGLGLWGRMPLALTVEAALVFAGLFVCLRATTLTRGRRMALAAFTLFLLGFTVAGMTVAPPPPSATAMAASSLAAIALVCVTIGWLGRGARATGDH